MNAALDTAVLRLLRERRTGKDARSGPSIPEDERTAKLVSLRLTPEDRELLDELAKEYGSRTAVLREGMALLMKRRG